MYNVRIFAFLDKVIQDKEKNINATNSFVLGKFVGY